jgi:hypothetical protein
MSTQVYSGPRVPPRQYISQLSGLPPSGDIIVNSITITPEPTLSTSTERPLVRKSADPNKGLVQLGSSVEIDDLIVNTSIGLDFFVTASDPAPTRCLTLNLLDGLVKNATNILADRVQLNVAPTVNNALASALAWNPVTKFIEQLALPAVPTAGTTAQVKDVAQTASSGADVRVLFPVVVVPDAGLTYDTGTGVFTVATAGQFTVSWTIAWDLDLTALGVRSTWLTANGNTVRYGQQIMTASVVPFPIGQSSSVSFSAPPGVTFEIHAFQTRGSNLDMLGTSAGPPNITLIDITRASIP